MYKGTSVQFGPFNSSNEHRHSDTAWLRFVVVCAKRENQGSRTKHPVLAKLCGLVTAVSLLGAVIAALAIILAKLASQFDQGIVTQALQICFAACFSILGMLILPIPGSAILYLSARVLPRFALSPIFSITAFSLGIYGMADLSTRTGMPAWVFNEAACYLNSLMCIR